MRRRTPAKTDSTGDKREMKKKARRVMAWKDEGRDGGNVEGEVKASS